MQQIYVLISVLVVLLGFGVFMHQTQYQNVRENSTSTYVTAKSLDSLDPAAGISYKSDNENYQQAYSKINGKKVYLSK